MQAWGWWGNHMKATAYTRPDTYLSLIMSALLIINLLHISSAWDGNGDVTGATNSMYIITASILQNR